jgi:Mg/Co/Ni transporter MgtE
MASPSKPTAKAPSAKGMHSPPSANDYIREHGVEKLLVEALKSAVDTESSDPIAYIGEYMLKKSKKGSSSEGSREDYVNSSLFTIVTSRMGWLVFFMFGLLLCANVMHGFEALLARELELSFFVPLLIGHGGNSGGQAVSTVIRALGSGSAKLSDGPKIIFKEAFSGVATACFCVCFLAPMLSMMGISERVVMVVSLTLPCVGLIANLLGSSLPFIITALGKDPAVIVGPLMTTSVDSLGLMMYLGIATLYLNMAGGASDDLGMCRDSWRGCLPAAGCMKSGGMCVPK